MACGGLEALESGVSRSKLRAHPVDRLLEVAFQMKSFMETKTYGPEGKSIRLKIGIHYGQVIAGIIGHHKPQFSLIGDTVNTTSRVCSTGLDNRITISNEAYNCVQSPGYYFQKRIVEV